MLAKLADIQSRLAQAEQAKAAAHEQMAALKAEQEAAVEKRVAESARRTCSGRRTPPCWPRRRRLRELQVASCRTCSASSKASRRNELGEGSEIDLFEQLRDAFEGDRIQRVGKGVNGADVIHEVVHNGRCAARSSTTPRTATPGRTGLPPSCSADKLAQAADHAILSSNKFPKDGAQVHTQDGVIVASPARVLAIVRAPARPDRAHARAAHQQGGARAEVGRALRLHHLRALQAAARPGRGAGRQDAGARHARSRRRTGACGSARASSSSRCRRRAATSPSRSTASSAPPATAPATKRRREIVIPECAPAHIRDPGSARSPHWVPDISLREIPG